jgi:hypothetical protein
MALQLLLAPGRNDQIGHLWRQEAPQPAHAFDFAYLVDDALFELLVESGKLLGLRPQLAGLLLHKSVGLLKLARPVAQFVQQPRVLDGNDRLGREVLHQFDLLISEWVHLVTEEREHSDCRSLTEKRHGKRGPIAGGLLVADAPYSGSASTSGM